MVIYLFRGGINDLKRDKRTMKKIGRKDIFSPSIAQTHSKAVLPNPGRFNHASCSRCVSWILSSLSSLSLASLRSQFTDPLNQLFSSRETTDDEYLLLLETSSFCQKWLDTTKKTGNITR